MTAKQIFLFLAWFLLFSFPMAAQEMGESVTEEVLNEEEQRQLQENLTKSQIFLMGHVTQSAFEKDINAWTLLMLSQANETGTISEPNKIREEFGITKEQAVRVEELISSMKVFESEYDEKSVEMLSNNFTDRAMKGDLYLTEEEEESIRITVDRVFERIEPIAAEVFTDEQREKADGMILALTGGLESPFFSERCMDALGMTDDQKKKFAAINEELKPERDKMVTEFINPLLEKGGINSLMSFQDFINSLSALKSYGREIKKRRSEVLTSEQIAKAMKLSKLPKALSIFNLLPKWTPNADSWKPGDPLPEGLVPKNPQPAPRFPIGEQYEE